MEDDDDILELEPEGTFNRAATFVQKETTAGTGKRPGQDVMLQIYGFYKTATIGKCTDPKPGLFDPRGRAKWTAWTNSSKLSKKDAMQGYIKLVREHYNWDDSVKSDADDSRNSSSFGGNAVSSFPVPQEDEDNEDQSCEDYIIFRWIKENNVDQVTKWMRDRGNNVNLQDADGLSLLHWAVDRGHIDLTKLLLEKNVDVSIKDEEGLTALDYAITCEHNELIALLQSHLPS